MVLGSCFVHICILPFSMGSSQMALVIKNLCDRKWVRGPGHAVVKDESRQEVSPGAWARHGWRWVQTGSEDGGLGIQLLELSPDRKWVRGPGHAVVRDESRQEVRAGGLSTPWLEVSLDRKWGLVHSTCVMVASLVRRGDSSGLYHPESPGNVPSAIPSFSSAVSDL